MKKLAAFVALGVLGLGALATTDAQAQYRQYGGSGGYYGGGYATAPVYGYYNQPTYYYAQPRTRVVVKRVVTYPSYSPYYGGGYYGRGYYGW